MLGWKIRRILTALAVATIPLLMQSACTVTVPYGEYPSYDAGGMHDGFYLDIWIEDDFDDHHHDDFFFDYGSFDWFIDWF